ncbi:DMT family transporter [Ruegeria sp. 2012CJ41-6]|uniref:DMT family transporter n=1 Tax=Ruegeria spongiae TaxID=2942209 RepID=A0ABT0Q3G4_9RHOB|nr:DMT family transporter [Ruegeria spongiae]MCL6284411.1 DMT family transporter [Ruegeria spongiae]
MTQDRPVLGITLMLAFCVLAPLGDAIAKLLSHSLPVSQLVVVRFGIQSIILVPLVWLTARPWRMPGRYWSLAALRTVLHIIGIGAMFTSLKYLPLADAFAIAFVMPFILLILGRFVLNEEVGKRRIIACTVGFAGTLMVIQPSFAAVGWNALWPLLVAVAFAFFILVTRHLAKDTDPVALQAVSGLMATGFLVPALVLGDAAGLHDLVITPPERWEAWLLLSIGLIGTVAHLLMTWSLRFAPSATLAPMQYLEIPMATLLGWLIFQDLPNGLSSLGIAITIGAGLYVILRERAIARDPGLETPA